MTGEKSRRKLISVISPAYNEADSLRELISRLCKTLGSMSDKYVYEIIIIDDGSRDKSTQILEDLQKEVPNLKYISHYRNHGKSLALMQGFDAATGDIAITMDADLQDIPELIPNFVKKIEEGYDFVVGWRVNRRDPWMKRTISLIFNGLTSKLLKCSVHDINCGYKAISREVYTRLELRGDLHRLMPAIAQIGGHSVTEVPIEHDQRKHGKSKFPLLRHRGLLDIIVLAASRSTQIRPFHVFCEWAFFLYLFGILLFAVALRTGLGAGVPNFANVGTLILLFFGAWLVLLASLMPFVGFLLDSLSAPAQEKSWRTRLIKKNASSGNTVG